MSLNYWLLVRRTGRKLKRILILLLVFVVLFTASTVVKNIVLGQIKKRPP